MLSTLTVLVYVTMLQCATCTNAYRNCRCDIGLKITGSAVALHCWKAHSKINRKRKMRTPVKSQLLKILCWNLAHVVTLRTSPTKQFFMYIASVGASPRIGEIWPFCDFFLYCPVLFSRSNAQLEPRDRYSRFMAQMTWFSPRTVLFALRRWVTSIRGMCPTPPTSPLKRGAWIGTFKPNYHNIETHISRPRFERFRRHLAQWRSSTLVTRPTIKNSKFQKSEMAAAAILKNRKSPYLGRDWSDLDDIWHSEAARPSWRVRLSIVS